ncbi:uncharacterized protein LOC131033325 isoform X3 [Cryptomeria japonica]|uniref:uncharacterized protein LOC131033325 isoform X3 n=1 Tax=Cryptomeria japonica TaxID=3369 RepID=UPI0027DA9E94|nr:uncharacterized protein LOC131033325 isoform X3 [Cryptomeria japonica]
MAEDAAAVFSEPPHFTAGGVKEKEKGKRWEGSAVFALAGLSNMCGSFVTNPVNVVKVRMQLDGALSSTQERQYRGLVSGFFQIGREEGIRGLWRGTGAALMREASYSSIRMGAYEPFKRALGGHDPAHTPLWIKVTAGSAAGIVGSAVANPTDVVIVRMQASSPGRGAIGEWRYTGPFHALSSILKNEGIRGLYRGISPTIQRAGILNAAQAPSYDHAKHILLNTGILQEGVPCHLISSVIAGFVTAIVISPIDLIKTRIMQQPVDVDGRGALYSSSIDCFKKTIRSEGVLSLYNGFVPVWMRIFPHTIVTFFIFEQLRKALGIAPV